MEGMQKTKIPIGEKQTKLLFWAIFGLAVLMRVLFYGRIPGGANQDEAMGAVDAWALSLYGTDRYGVSFPVHFSAWQISQMSVLLSYLMIPFIKVFGFHTWVIRLPMLLASIVSVVLMYLIGRKLLDERFGLLVMALTAINPWHFMQSRWSIDCNLFPHVFLLAFYLLLLGLERKRYLYLSMVFFGLTFYCYGIAVYSVTAFLAVFALWGWKNKLFRLREVVLCILIFGVVALPEGLVMAINLFHWDTISFGPVTMSRFPETLRGGDILFLNFSLRQLWKNVQAMVNCSFLQLPDYWFNAIPLFGPMYHISIPFMAGGAFFLTKDLFREKQVLRRASKLAVWGFLLTGIWVGIITAEVNVNRINLIFYALILSCAYGIRKLTDAKKKLQPVVYAIFALASVLFFATYFTVYPGKVKHYYNEEFLQAVKQVDEMDADRLYITGEMGWQFNQSMAQILTQYSCKIDAKYYQEESVVTGGRELLPYSERYHFINVANYDFSARDRDGIYLLHQKDLEKMARPDTGDGPIEYEVLEQIGEFSAVRMK